MLLGKAVLSTLIWVHAYGAAIPIIGAELAHSRSSSESFSNENSVLHKELDSIMLPEKISDTDDSDDGVLILPKHLINERVLNEIGFRNRIKHCKKFKLNNKSFDSQLEILIPEKTVPFFLFNTSDELNVPKEKTKFEYANFIDHSAPFDLPEFASLVDYYLILPLPQTLNIKNLPQGIILTSKNKLPLFKQSLVEHDSYIVFMFRSGNDVFEAKEFNIPILKAKSYLGSNHISSFFDIFAQKWMEDISYSPLLHSVFCTLNVNYADQSYCLKIKEDMSSLSLFPAYSKLTGSQIKSKGRPKDTLQKRAKSLRQSSHNEKSEPKKYRELSLPLSLIKVGDEAISSSSPRANTYSQVLDPNSLRKLGLSKREETYSTAKLDEIRNMLEERLRIKTQKNRAKENSHTYVVSQAGNLKNKNREKFQDYVEAGKVGKKIPKEEKGDEKAVASQNASSRAADPNHDETTSQSSTLQEEKNCVQITWYNVFHHSIYGDQKFCGVN